MAKHRHADERGRAGLAAVQAGYAPGAATGATADAEISGVENRNGRNAAVSAGAGADAEITSDAADPATWTANGRPGLQTAAGAIADADAQAQQMTEEARRAFRHQLLQQRAYAYDRAGHLAWVSRIVALSGLVAGGAVFSELATSGAGKYLLGVAIPVITSAELVFEFARRGERWREIINETDALLTCLDATHELTAEDLRALRERYDAIKLPNERLYPAAQAAAWNVASREMGNEKWKPVSRWRALTRNLWAGSPDGMR